MLPPFLGQLPESCVSGQGPAPLPSPAVETHPHADGVRGRTLARGLGREGGALAGGVPALPGETPEGAPPHLRTQLEGVPRDSGGGPSPDTDPADALTLGSLPPPVCCSYAPGCGWSGRDRAGSLQRSRKAEVGAHFRHSRLYGRGAEASPPCELGAICPPVSGSCEQRNPQFSPDAAPQMCPGRTQELDFGGQRLFLGVSGNTLVSSTGFRDASRCTAQRNAA